MMRALPVLLGVLCASCGELPCLPLSPECARAEADLAVEVTAIPDGVTRVRIDADGQVRETDRISGERSATLYFYGLDDDVTVSVALEGTEQRACGAQQVHAGKGAAMHVDGAQCPVVTGPLDAGVDAGTDTAVDAGDDEEDDGGRDNEDAGVDELLLLAEQIDAVPEEEPDLRTEVLTGGFLVVQNGDGQRPSMQLSSEDYMRIRSLALDPSLSALLSVDNPCDAQAPDHVIRVVTRARDAERNVAGCSDGPITAVSDELARLRAAYFP